MYLENAWYMAAWASEIGDGLVEKTICDRKVLLYRKQDGTAVAIGALCPHRFAPLSFGKKIGDNVQCGYHGMEFGPHGACVHNPHHGGHIAQAMKVPCWPLVERHGILWFWPGDAALADAALIPDFSCYETPGFTTLRGVIDMQANYELVTDNLLDLTHGEFLHAGLLSSRAITVSKLETYDRGTTIWSNRWCPDDIAPPVWGHLLQSQLGLDPATARVDHWLYMRWDAPAHMLLDVGITPVGKTREEGTWVFTGHHLTPVSAKRCLYHWSVVRNYGLGDPAIDGFWQMSIDAAFGGQDQPLIEAQQAAIGDRDIETMGAVAIRADLAGAKARRMVRKLAAAEANGGVPAPSGLGLEELLTASAGTREPVLPVV